MEKDNIIEIVERNIKEDYLRNDIDVLTPIINANEITSNQLTFYLQSIRKNMEFFRKELNYPLQLSNLLLFELDARNIKSNKGRGSNYRYVNVCMCECVWVYARARARGSPHARALAHAHTATSANT